MLPVWLCWTKVNPNSVCSVYGVNLLSGMQFWLCFHWVVHTCTVWLMVVFSLLSSYHTSCSFLWIYVWATSFVCCSMHSVCVCMFVCTWCTCVCLCDLYICILSISPSLFLPLFLTYCTYFTAVLLVPSSSSSSIPVVSPTSVTPPSESVCACVCACVYWSLSFLCYVCQGAVLHSYVRCFLMNRILVWLWSNNSAWVKRHYSKCI